ncbi:hypothetical protein BS47DRAFT_1345213, partial [Hydnum rufescens UP504]
MPYEHAAVMKSARNWILILSSQATLALGILGFGNDRRAGVLSSTISTPIAEST